MSRPKNSHDGAIPSGNSVALKVLLQLARRTGQSQYEDKAKALLAYFSAKISENPAAYSYMLLGAKILQAGESGAHQYAARGAVAVHVTAVHKHDQTYVINLDLTMKQGWHVNAHQPMQKNLIPTIAGLGIGMSAWRLVSVEYPEPDIRRLQFQRNALLLYEGSRQIKIKLERINPDKAGIIRLKLQLQACSQESCLAPEQLLLQTAVHH